jgi:hypothetical protein
VPCPRPRCRSRWRALKALERCAGAALLCLLGACRNDAAPTIHVVLGPTPNDEASFAPRSALAELIEISPTETALLLNLTSAERSCDALAAPTPDDVGVSLRLTLPGGAKLAPGSFAMAQAAPSPDQPSLLATVRLRGSRHELLPGGELSLTQIDPSPQGVVEGLLKLEFTGDAEHPATRVAGRFLAHFCRISRLR